MAYKEVNNFRADLAAAKPAEEAVFNAFESRSDAYEFRYVADNPEYFHKGDILAIEKATGRKIPIEVKRDTCIWYSQNVLCEYSVFYYDLQETRRGNIFNEGNIYCVVSPRERLIYVMSLEVLQQHYQEGKLKRFDYNDQYSITYLLPLSKVKEYGGLIATISY